MKQIDAVLHDRKFVAYEVDALRAELEWRDGRLHALKLYRQGDQQDEDAGSIRLTAIETDGLRQFLLARGPTLSRAQKPMSPARLHPCCDVPIAIGHAAKCANGKR